MLKIYNIKYKQEYIKEIAELTQKEWGKPTYSKEEFNAKVSKKICKIKENLDNPLFCKLISIFAHDCDERMHLSPRYATMYVKKEFRGTGYSKILNDAILEEAKNRGFKRLYLKTELNNYYEKFGAIFLENLNNGEKIYYFSI